VEPTISPLVRDDAARVYGPLTPARLASSGCARAPETLCAIRYRTYGPAGTIES